MKTFQNIKNITLSSEKKNQMWANITHKIGIAEISLVENVRMEDADRHTFGGAYAKPSSLSPKKKYMANTKIFATMILILASIMGTSFAAERALPGDALYGFKVGVNESVRGAFNFDAQDRAQWEITKIERRAQEKGKLMAKARLTVQAQSEIESRSEHSAENAQDSIILLRKNGKTDVATSLEVSLNSALNAVGYSDATHKSDTNNEAHASGDTDVKVDTNARVTIPVIDLKIKNSSDGSAQTGSNNSDTDTSSDINVDGSVKVDVQGSVKSQLDNTLNLDTHQSGDSEVQVDSAVDTVTNVHL